MFGLSISAFAFLAGCGAAPGASSDDIVSSQSAASIPPHGAPFHDVTGNSPFTIEIGADGGTSATPQGGYCHVQSYAGRATNVDVTADANLEGLVVGASVVVNDTGALASTGGNLYDQVANADVAGIVTTGVLTAATASNHTSATSTSSIDALNVDVAGITITANTITANASAECAFEAVNLAGTSQIVGLTIGGTPIVVTGAPNQTIDVAGLVDVVINEVTTSSTGGDDGQITENALHISALGIADVVISHASAGVTCNCHD
jgi:hypothetical protein